MSQYWILDENREPKPVNLLEWSTWFEQADRQIKETYLRAADGQQIRISTVFLGLDHSFNQGPLPLIYETMVFGGKLDDLQERYTYEQEALFRHQEIIREVMEAEGIVDGMEPSTPKEGIDDVSSGTPRGSDDHGG